MNSNIILFYFHIFYLVFLADNGRPRVVEILCITICVVFFSLLLKMATMISGDQQDVRSWE